MDISKQPQPPPTMASGDDRQPSNATADRPPRNPVAGIPPQPYQQTQQPSQAGNTGEAPQQAQERDRETLFRVSDYALARNADTDVYRELVHELHKQMAGGGTSEYVETKIPLPPSLQGLKTGQVVSRLLAVNPSLDSDAWTHVTADVFGANLIVGTVSESGRKKINDLREVKVEPGRTAKVPAATKPNNFYYVELYLPYERELHVELMKAFLLKFPSATNISMPGKKPWGTTRCIRLYFNETTAPKEVFTSDDANIPIREITLSNGTAAQIIHKWQRLNQHRPPHLMNRWNKFTPAQSYATAASRENATLRLEQPQASNHAAHANTGTFSKRLLQRPGEVAAVPPPQHVVTNASEHSK